MHLYVHYTKGFMPSIMEQWYTRDEYHKFQNAEYWFVLHTDQHEKVAECAVHHTGNLIPCLKWGGSYFQISDVLVYPAFRGNSYCALLLLNVFYYFAHHPETQGKTEHGMFRWWTSRQNISAIKAYKKIAKIVNANRQIVEFST